MLFDFEPFQSRHIGSDADERDAMLKAIGAASLDALIDEAIPARIRLPKPLNLPDGESEYHFLRELRQTASRNQIWRSYIGLGYAGCITPSVILRNVLENPGWYTPYTPYQAEIAQGRLESLLNFQTMVRDLTAMEVANASLLDEATAAAEAMHMCRAIAGAGRNVFFAAQECHPQTLAVVRTRARSLGIDVRVGPAAEVDLSGGDVFGVLLQYPATDGRVVDDSALVQRAHDAGALVAVATDLLALTLLRPPGEFGADIALGSSQRFGVPMGYGGPHAAFLSTKDEYKRQMPGRLIGVSKDADGRVAYRMALQTREQHIRREKATSNICTNQALIALMVNIFMTVYGKVGLKELAKQNLSKTAYAAGQFAKHGKVLFGSSPRFNEFVVQSSEDPYAINSRLLGHKMVGGLPLKKFYPELGNAALWCCTEMTTRTAIDTAVGLVAESERSVRSGKEEVDVEEVAR